MYGGVRLLGNLPGMWLLEECRRIWGAGSVAELLDGPATDPARTPTIDVDDPTLVAPVDMPAAVRDLAGLPAEAPRRLVVDCLVESLAAAVAGAVDRLAATAPCDELVVFGGAAQATPILERIGRLIDRPVRTGPAEATTLGNALAQGIALGAFSGVNDARRALAPAD